MISKMRDSSRCNR